MRRFVFTLVNDCGVNIGYFDGYGKTATEALLEIIRENDLIIESGDKILIEESEED